MGCVLVNGFHLTFLEEPLQLSDCYLFDSNDTLCNPTSFIQPNPSTTYLNKKILLKYPTPEVSEDGYTLIKVECRNGLQQDIKLPVGNPRQASIVSFVTSILPLLAYVIVITGKY